jgi:glycosyltransferase involved in cell wall biosynthesis
VRIDLNVPAPNSIRRWLPFDVGRPPLDGYLDETATGTDQLRSICSLDEFAEIQCLVLLGQAGMGKTYAAHFEVDALRQSGEMVDFVSLGREPDPGEALLRLLASDHASEFVKGRNWYIFLDGIDETAGPPATLITEVGRLLDTLFERGDADRLRLRLLCRTSAWSIDHDRLVEVRWREDQVRKLELGPLSKHEITDLVAAKLPDRVQTFLNSIEEHNAEALAARPVLLFLLLDLFLANDTFPNTRARLYQLGLERLILSAQVANALGKRVDLERRLLISSRIAVATTFSGLSQITADPGLPTDDAVHLADLVGQLEPAEGEALGVTTAEVRAALATPLFARIAPDTFEWAHRTFMEFLAAHYLVVRQVPAPDLWNLLLVADPDGKQTVAPHLREVAAWLAGMVPDFFRLLVKLEPKILLRSDLAAATPQDRSLLVDALLDRIADEELYDFFDAVRPYLGKLGHPNLHAQLASRLADKSQGHVLRRIVVDIAHRTELRSFIPVLLKVALDEGDALDVRKASVDAVSAFGTPEDKAQLTPILTSDLSSDLSDELRGSILRATWSGQLSDTALIGALTPLKNENFIGAYAMFLHRLEFRPRSTADVIEAITWLTSALDADGAEKWARQANRVFPRIFWACAAKIAEKTVRRALASLIVDRFQAVVRYVLHVSPSEGSGWPREATPRRALVIECLNLAQDPERLATGLLLQGRGLIQADDLDAYVDLRFSDREVIPSSAFLSIIVGLTHQLPIDSLDRVWKAAEQDEALSNALQAAYSVDRHSTEAKWLRKSWQNEKTATDATKSSPPDALQDAEVANLLDRIEGGTPSLWWQLNLQLFVDASGSYQSDFEFRGDLRAAPGWAVLSPKDQKRVIYGAKAYLVDAPLTNLTWLGTSTSLRPASAGYRALRLLLDVDPEALEHLKTTTWRRWAPVTLGFFENDFYTECDEQQRLLAIAYERAPDAILGAITRIALGSKSQGISGRVFDLIKTIADDPMRALLSRLSGRSALKGAGAQGKVLGFLARVGDNEVIEQVQAALESGGTLQNGDNVEAGHWLIECSAQILLNAPQEIWVQLLGLNDRNSELARSIWGKFAEISDIETTDALKSIRNADLAKAYVQLSRLFPEKVEQAGGMRLLQISDGVEGLQSILLTRLVNAGTSDALETLISIANALPGSGLEWRVEEARRNYRLKMQPKLGPSEILAQIATIGMPLETIGANGKGTATRDPVSVDSVPAELHIALPKEKPQGKLIDAERRNILSLATEWSSGHGGISTLNRELCIALANLGHSVWCAVTEAGPKEIEDAQNCAVKLIVCPESTGIDDTNRLLLLTENDFSSTKFDVLLGHDHITGPFASALARRFSAKYIHFLHTVPQQTEILKTRNMTRTLLKGDDKRKKQIELGKTADLIIAIGPKIYNVARMGFDDHINLQMMLPGLSPDLLDHKPDLSKFSRNHCLISARMEDASAKGLRLACEAVLVAAKGVEWTPGARPRLVAQGFDRDRAEEEYAAISGSYEQILEARPYTTDRAEIRNSLSQASILLMPSQSEGFGLTGYEAIAAGIPVLISDESGLAEYINAAVSENIITRDAAFAIILPALEETAGTKWAPRIVSLLQNRDEAFENAAALRDKLRPILSWEKAARKLSAAIQNLD